MLRIKGVYSIGLLLFLFHSIASFGQEISGVTVWGASGVIKTIDELKIIDSLNPMSGNIRIRAELKAGNKNKKPSVQSLPGNRFPIEGSDTMVALQNTTQAIHSNFQGIQVNESGSLPPDPMGAVSETQICVAANGRIKWYNKPSVCDAPVTTSTTTNAGSLGSPVFSISLRNFFTSVLNGSDITDPHLYYDRLSARWYIVAINIENASNRVVIAVSNNNVINNASSFTFYFFNHDQGAPVGSPDRGAFFDYPMLGLDRHAMYIGGIIFNAAGNFTGSSCFVVNKASLISAGPIQFTAFRQVGAANTGIFAPQGVYNDDPAATRGYFVGVDNEVFSRLRYVVVNNPGSVTPTITQSQLNVPATYFPYLQPALGSIKPLDALGDERLLNAQMMRNKLTGQSAIWTAHHIAVNATGAAVNADGVAGARNAVRWYQLGENNGTLTLAQSGTLFDNAATNPKGYWMGSIAATGQGHAVAGSSVAATNLHANAIVAGRFASQAAGLLNPPVNVTNFTAVYNLEDDEESQRWGDYSQTYVDPSDDMTVWTFQEYTNANNSWAVRATQLKAPPPATPVSITPITCSSPRIADVTLTGQSNNFSGFYDPGEGTGGPAYTRRLALSSTGGALITNVQFISPTQIRFNLNYSNAPLGSQQTLTITNPDCQSVTFNYTLPTSCVTDSTNVPGRTITITPNPPDGNEVTVLVPAPIGIVRVYAIDGKLLAVYPVSSSAVRINVALYPKGIYLVEYTDGSRRQTTKMVLR